jgi:hypothetical protein
LAIAVFRDENVTTTEFMNRRQWRSITFLVIRRLEEPLGRGSSAAQAFRQLLNSTDWYSNGFAQMDDVQLSPRDHLVQGRAANAERSRRLNDWGVDPLEGGHAARGIMPLA